MLRQCWFGRHSQILRDLRRLSKCADFCYRMDSCYWRTRTLQQSAGDCWMRRPQRREAPESRNAYCDWLDSAARPSSVFFLIFFFEDLNFLRRVTQHSLVGLDNGAMLLLGGTDWGSGGDVQTGIWELKEEQWSRIGELSQV